MARRWPIHIKNTAPPVRCPECAHFGGQRYCDHGGRLTSPTKAHRCRAFRDRRTHEPFQTLVVTGRAPPWPDAPPKPKTKRRRRP